MSTEYRFKESSKSDSSSKQINSAKLFIRNDTQNKLVELSMELDKLKLENKTVKRMHAREEVAFTKLENHHIDLKKTIKKHVEEINNLKLELQKSWEQNKKLTSNLIIKDEELRELRKKYTKLANAQ